ELRILVENRREVLGDRRERDRLVPGKIRDAEAAADIEQLRPARRVLQQPPREIERLPVRVADELVAKVLRAAEDMEAAEAQPELSQPPQRFRHPLGIDAELLRAAAHLHPG